MTERVSGMTAKYDIAEDEFEAMSAERQRDYEINELLDQELGLKEPETGNDLMAQAAVVLKSRGIAIEAATQDELRDALLAVSS